MARKRNHERRLAAISRALALATEAIDLLDAYDGPPDVAAHLEIVRQKLQDALKATID